MAGSVWLIHMTTFIHNLRALNCVLVSTYYIDREPSENLENNQIIQNSRLLYSNLTLAREFSSSKATGLYGFQYN